MADELSSTYITFLPFNPGFRRRRLLLLVRKRREGEVGAHSWPRRKHIHKTALYHERLPPSLPPSLQRRGVAVEYRSAGEYVEFISTKPRETAAANHELRPITGIVTGLTSPLPAPQSRPEDRYSCPRWPLSMAGFPLESLSYSRYKR